MVTKSFRLAAVPLALGLALAAGAHAQISDGVVKIGILTDMSGPYSSFGGKGSVVATNLAIEDCLKAECSGMKIEVLSADHQNKADIASSKARDWFDTGKLDAIMDVAVSAPALAVLEVAKQKQKVIIFNGPGTDRLTNDLCMPSTVHYVYDTYALANVTASAITQRGAKDWYFITADYAFGHSLQEQASAVVNAQGGKVLGAVRFPFGSPDFSSFLLQAQASRAKVVGLAFDRLAVSFGLKILQIIPGRVSTEVDARLSYDTAATVAKGRELIAQYEANGVSRERILIKIASTWEGIQAAKALEAEGVHCNLTLLFGLHQAQACAEAGVTLISPFVGRILDWYKKAENVSSYPVEQDPGVLSVKQIYHYYKQRSVKTEIMGASFRSIDQVLGLAGCDLLTVAPNLLAELEQDTREVQLQLSEKQSQASSEQLFDTLDRESFKALLEHDLMAFQLLQSGIDGFIKAREQLSTLLRQSFGYDAEIQA